MKSPFKCLHCNLVFDAALTLVCPFCGHPGPQGKPRKPGWGGKRAGAGAPRANLNRLVHGRDSKLLRLAVEKLAEDPELRAFLLLLARAAIQGELPQTTKNLILKALPSPRREAAVARLRGLRDE